VSSYFYCGIQLGGLLDDAERDLLAIAKFLVGVQEPLNTSHVLRIVL